MAQHIRARLRWSKDDEALPASAIIKLPSTSPDDDALAVRLGYYERELNFYRDLAFRVGLRAPRYFYSAKDAGSRGYVLVIEDLAGLDVVEQIRGLDTPRAFAVMQSLGHMDGSWWNSDELARLEWLPLSFGAGEGLVGNLLDQGWPSWSSQAVDIVDQRQLKLAREYVESVNQIMELSPKEPFTLVHGDFRLDNMMFDKDEPVVFDWATVSRGGLLLDLTYFLSTSLTVESRRQHHARLIEVYRDAVAETAHGLDDREFDRQLRLAALSCLIEVIIAGSKLMLRPEDRRWDDLMIESHHRLFTLLDDLEAWAELPA